MQEDRTALSYWFPKLEAAGIPVPETHIVTMPVAAQESLFSAFDGQEGKDREALPAFAQTIAALGCEVGGPPYFLRTDHTSDKHSWDRTCFVDAGSNIVQHIFNIAEFSECADILGIPWSTWVIREFLPTIPLGICPRYRNMPICREFRFFVDDGAVRCWHPYWPQQALEQGGADSSLDYDGLCRVGIEDNVKLIELASAAGRAVGGSWSVDILETKRGWYVTDMAEAYKSFHWEGCLKVKQPAESAS